MEFSVMVFVRRVCVKEREREGGFRMQKVSVEDTSRGTN